MGTIVSRLVLLSLGSAFSVISVASADQCTLTLPGPRADFQNPCCDEQNYRCEPFKGDKSQFTEQAQVGTYPVQDVRIEQVIYKIGGNSASSPMVADSKLPLDHLAKGTVSLQLAGKVASGEMAGKDLTFYAAMKSKKIVSQTVAKNVEELSLSPDLIVESTYFPAQADSETIFYAFTAKKQRGDVFSLSQRGFRNALAEVTKLSSAEGSQFQGVIEIFLTPVFDAPIKRFALIDDVQSRGLRMVAIDVNGEVYIVRSGDAPVPVVEFKNATHVYVVHPNRLNQTHDIAVLVMDAASNVLCMDSSGTIRKLSDIAPVQRRDYSGNPSLELQLRDAFPNEGNFINSFQRLKWSGG